MLRRIKAKILRVQNEKENKLKELLEIQNELKKIDGKMAKLNGFMNQYEQLVNKFNEFLKNEFIK